MKFDTCAVRVSLSQVWAVSWAWKMWKVHVRERATATATATENNEGNEGKGRQRSKAAMNEKSAWRMQFWKCPQRVELTNWLNEWLDCSDYWLLTVELQTADWWNDWLLHWQAGQSLQQQRSWWNSCSLIRKSRSNCKKIHRTMWDTILSSERYATNVATIQFY